MVSQRMKWQLVKRLKTTLGFARLFDDRKRTHQKGLILDCHPLGIKQGTFLFTVDLSFQQEVKNNSLILYYCNQGKKSLLYLIVSHVDLWDICSYSLNKGVFCDSKHHVFFTTITKSNTYVSSLNPKILVYSDSCYSTVSKLCTCVNALLTSMLKILLNPIIHHKIGGSVKVNRSLQLSLRISCFLWSSIQISKIF